MAGSVSDDNTAMLFVMTIAIMFCVSIIAMADYSSPMQGNPTGMFRAQPIGPTGGFNKDRIQFADICLGENFEPVPDGTRCAEDGSFCKTCQSGRCIAVHSECNPTNPDDCTYCQSGRCRNKPNGVFCGPFGTKFCGECLAGRCLMQANVCSSEGDCSFCRENDEGEGECTSGCLDCETCVEETIDDGFNPPFTTMECVNNEDHCRQEEGVDCGVCIASSPFRDGYCVSRCYGCEECIEGHCSDDCPHTDLACACQQDGTCSMCESLESCGSDGAHPYHTREWGCLEEVV